MITHTFEPLRPLAAPDNGAAFAWLTLWGWWRVHYGNGTWPSHSYWVVPGTMKEDNT